MTNLKRIIDEKGVQQRWLAEQVGVTEVSMCRYVNGKRTPKVPLAIRMADVLGVDVKELYGWDDAHVAGEPTCNQLATNLQPCKQDDLISRQAAIDHLKKRLYETALNNNTEHPYYEEIADNRVDIWMNEVPSAQPETHEERTETHTCDCISRQAAIDALNVGAELLRRVLDDADIVGAERAKYEWGLGLIESYISDMKELPSAQPDSKELSFTQKKLDTISRQAAIDALDKEYRCTDHSDDWDGLKTAMLIIENLPSAQPYERCIVEIKMGKDDLEELVAEKVEEIKKNMPAQPLITEPHWIPCSERLPEDDVEVLISYRYKEGEGDTSHTDIDITTYGQMYFGGNKVGNYKHWRAPFEYFESNYEVIAWMPLPEPYAERRTNDG